MTKLVVGANGFLGSHVTRRLVAGGHDVRVMVRESANTTGIDDLDVQRFVGDIWDDDAHTCVFRQVSGDYDKLEGTWKFVEEDGGTRFDSYLEYEYIVPAVGPLVKKVVHSIVIKNMESVLGAIKERAEKA